MVSFFYLLISIQMYSLNVIHLKMAPGRTPDLHQILHLLFLAGGRVESYPVAGVIPDPYKRWVSGPPGSFLSLLVRLCSLCLWLYTPGFALLLFYLLFFYSVLMYYLAVHMSLLIKLCFKNACYFFPEDFLLSNLIFIGFKKLDLQTIG